MIEFWKGVFSDNGSPSFSRIGTFFALLAVIGWVTHIVLKTHSLPDFAGPSWFVGTLYGLNGGTKVLTTLGSSISQKGDSK